MTTHTPPVLRERKHFQLLAIALLVATFIGVLAWSYPDAARAQTAPTLGDAQSFAVLGSTTVTNTGDSIINGDVGVYAGTSITGFPPGVIVGGTMYPGTAEAQTAQASASAAFDALDQPCTADLSGQDLGGMTLTTGVYCFSATAALTGTLTLDGQGDPDAVFIFKTGSTLDTASTAVVLMQNSAQACNTFWRVGSSATLGTFTEFAGDIIASASITLTTSANSMGRLLALTGAVTLDTNNVTATECQVIEPTATSTSTATATSEPTATSTTAPATATIESTSTVAAATATATATATTTGATSTPDAAGTATPAPDLATPTSTTTSPPAATPTATPSSTTTIPPGTATATPSPTATPVATETATPPSSLPQVPQPPAAQPPAPLPPSTGNVNPATDSGSFTIVTLFLAISLTVGGLAIALAGRRKASDLA